MAEEPQAATPQTRPKRRYTVSAKVLEANHQNPEKARAVLKEIRYRTTERRRVACRQNLLKERARRPVGQRPPIAPGLVRWLAGWLAPGDRLSRVGTPALQLASRSLAGWLAQGKRVARLLGARYKGASTLRSEAKPRWPECCHLPLGPTISSNFKLEQTWNLIENKESKKIDKAGTWNVYENKPDS